MTQNHFNTLKETPAGRRVRIRHLHCETDTSIRLREIGIHENAIVRCLSIGNGNIVCEVSSGRVGIGQQLAEVISVSTVE